MELTERSVRCAVHDESVREDSIEKLLDDKIRRRFGEWITRATERKKQLEGPH
jgi:hypothetical protein